MPGKVGKVRENVLGTPFPACLAWRSQTVPVRRRSARQLVVLSRLLDNGDGSGGAARTSGSSFRPHLNLRGACRKTVVSSAEVAARSVLAPTKAGYVPRLALFEESRLTLATDAGIRGVKGAARFFELPMFVRSGPIADCLEPRLRGLRSMICLGSRQALSTCARPGGFRRFARSPSAHLGGTLAAVLSCGLATGGGAAAKTARTLFMRVSAVTGRFGRSAVAAQLASPALGDLGKTEATVRSPQVGGRHRSPYPRGSNGSGAAKAR